MERVRVYLSSDHKQLTIFSTPVIIFLSDGEDYIPENLVRDFCDTAVSLGCALSLNVANKLITLASTRKPPAFYTVSFGQPRHSAVLRAMAQTAREVYRLAAPDVVTIPCDYRNALDTVYLSFPPYTESDSP